MSRPKKNRLVMRSMCARLAATIDLMEESDSQISKILGYANPATIARMRAGEAFIDPERLAIFASIAIREEIRPNLHWILTGHGEPVIAIEEKKLAAALCILIQESTKKMLQNRF